MTAKSFFAGGMGSAIAGARAVATTHATQQRAPIGADDSALWYARAALADDNLDDQTRLLACEYVIANSPDTTEHARANGHAWPFVAVHRDLADGTKPSAKIDPEAFL